MDSGLKIAGMTERHDGSWDLQTGGAPGSLSARTVGWQLRKRHPVRPEVAASVQRPSRRACSRHTGLFAQSDGSVRESTTGPPEVQPPPRLRVQRREQREVLQLQVPPERRARQQMQQLALRPEEVLLVALQVMVVVQLQVPLALRAPPGV